MGGGRGKSKSKSKSKSKPKTKAQKMAVSNKAKYGGTAKAAAANKAAGKAKAKAKHTASQAAKKSTPSKGGSISKGTTGIGPVKSGATYSKAVSKATNAPTKKTSGIGPYADGAKYAAALKASPPKLTDGTKVASGVTGYGLRPDGVTGEYKEGDIYNTGGKSGKDYIYKGVPGKGAFVPVKTAMLPGDDNLGGPAALLGGVLTIGGMGVNAIKNMKDNFAPKLRENLEKKLNPDADKVSAAGNLTGLGIGTGAPSYFSIKSPESFGAPSQAETDAAAGITAGGLNIGGSGFTPSKTTGASTSRAISDGASKVSFGPTADGNEYANNITNFGMKFGATPEARGKAYEQSLDPNSFKGLSDGMTFGVGPVASGDAYAKGLNVAPYGSVENTMRSVVGKIPLINKIPVVKDIVNTRLLTDKEIADKRVKAAAFREANLVGRKKGGGARLPVAPLTPEEILLPEAIAQTAPDYQQIEGQTGLDPNRLLQIQQEAYQQAFNPYNPLTVGGFNPFFRFFDRRRGQRRGAFRRAFRRD